MTIQYLQVSSPEWLWEENKGGTGALSLIPPRIPGLFLFWTGWRLEGLEEGSSLHPWNPTSTRALGQLLQLLPKALPDGSHVVSVRRSQGADIARDTTSGLLFPRNQMTRLSPCTRKGGLRPKGLDLVSAFTPETVEKSKVGICYHPHPTHRGAEVLGFLPLPPTQGLGAKYISHCTQHMRGGEATWEGKGGVGEAIGRWAQTPQEHGMPQAEAWRAWKPILTLCSWDGGWLEQTIDLFLPCRSSGRSRLRLSRDKEPQCHPFMGSGPQEGAGKQEGCDAQLVRGEGSGCESSIREMD